MTHIRLFFYYLLFVCALGFPCHIHAQKVVGNKFYGAVLNKSQVVSTRNATITAKKTDGTPVGGGTNYIGRAFDGNNETWWASTSAGTVNVDIKFNVSIDLSGFHIHSGGETQEREQWVIVYISSDGNSWSKVAELEGNRSQRDNDYVLDQPVNTSYLRLQFEPGRSDYTLAMNEITLYSDSYVSANTKVEHKKAKWFDLRGEISEAAKNMDTYNDETPWFLLQDGTTQIQAAHVYMDTIYVHKGTSVNLIVPDKLNNSSVVSYQRWYSFRTDGTFRTQNSGRGDVWDLLTPVGTVKPYRMDNGYIGKPLTTNDLMEMSFYVPTDEEFKVWFGNAGSNYDNNYYLVGCDVSGYTDYTQNFSITSSGSSQFFPSNQEGGSYEPTLTHRIIYYIQAVDNRDSEEGNTEVWQDGMGRLKKPEYQGGEVSGKYLEEYDISFPFTRVSDNTLELVALSKDARSYSIPDANSDNDNLNVKLIDGGSGISLHTNTLSGMSRIIQFEYPNSNNSDQTEYVNANNSKATICVTKEVDGITYNIAKYNLTFVRDTRLITQSQLKQIEDGTIQDENMKYYQFRTDKYLEENYDLLTQLNFDYDEQVGNIYGQNGFYPFPLDWTSSSYSFYDGSDGQDFKPSASGHYYPEWGYYSIMNGFIENIANWNNAPQGSLLPGSRYHMYIDASDRAGVIARLPFQQNLCAGSEMFVTAWVKSAGYSKTTPDAGMLFSVMGVTKDGTGQDVYVPIYRHASSQIRRTDYLEGGMPGTGTGTNEWMQVYFSFIVKNDVPYTSYVLQVDNNSESTSGGDMYIDDIRVYLATPSAKVSQLESTCTNERTMMSIELDWERLLSRLGDVEGTDGIEAIDFCFIDKAKYETYLSAHPEDYVGAIEASVVEIGNNEQGEGFYNEKYNTMYFDLTFDKNASYDSIPHPRLARDNEGTGANEGKFFFYRTTDEAGIKALAVDFYSALTPNRSYMMLIQVNNGDKADATDFAESLNDACGIITPFYVTAQTLLRVNGEVVDPTTDFCAGQIFSFSAQMRIPQSNSDGTESYITVDKGVYFDWFFGSEEEFLAANPTYGEESLESALLIFRDIFPDKEDLEGVNPGDYQMPDGTVVNLSSDMIELIRSYISASGPDGALNNRLVLHKDKIDITLLQSGLKLVVQPIPTLMPPGDIDENLWANVCWSYIPLELNASGEAPQVRAGFNALKYPSDEFNPGLRIGLNQIKNLNAKSLKVSLRGAKLVTEGAESLGLITSVSPDVFNKIYLIDTNDPAYKNETFFPADFSEYSLPVGTIKSLKAQPYGTSSTLDDQMEICFDTETTQDNGFRFNPKEGYFYTLAFHFEEKMEDGFSSANSCFGVFNVDMKVVPEYLVWSASDANGNWNNDANWKRADIEDLKKTQDDGYPTNEENTTANGYVPMLFSNVIMPEGSKAELYMAGFGDSGNSWVNDSRPAHMLPPTENIQFDLMTYDNNGQYSAERYRVNLCRDIHFEPGAQMLHAEQLLYNKAWVDVEIPSGKWNTVSVPLQDVVAGDWYAPTANGRQETEYFKDINFADDGYSRLNPAVYQRSWGTGATIVESQTPNTPVSFDTEWSSVYNDASVPYTAGGGFSVKGAKTGVNSLLFRFPKADTSYDVSTVTGNLKRDQSGKLLVSGLLDRSNPLVHAPQENVSTTIVPSADGKYLMIGNPFMAPFDVQAFVKANEEVLLQKYWTGDNLAEEQAVVYNQETGKWSADTYLAEPYAVFYVSAIDPETAKNGLELIITASMQKFKTDVSGGNETPEVLETPEIFRIEAMDAYGKSTATLNYSPSADNQYQSEEDAEMIQNLDGNNSPVPMVYTVAGDRAASANQVKDSRSVPLGVFAAEDSPVTVVFRGVETLNHAVLYDAESGRETLLTEGYSFTVNGSSHGRYFIRTDEVTGMESQMVDDLSVYSVVPNQVIVASDSQLGEITVWSTDGTLIKTVRPDSNVCTLNGISSGVVLVKVQSETPVVRKVMVK